MDKGRSGVMDRQEWLRLVIVALALTLTEPVYLVVCYALRSAQGGEAFEGLISPEAQQFALSYRWYAVGAAVALAALSYVFRRVLVSSMAAVAGKLKAQEGGEGRIFRAYFTMVLMSMSLCETGGILGLLYFLATGDFAHTMILLGVAFAAKYGHWPRMGEFRRISGETGPAK